MAQPNKKRGFRLIKVKSIDFSWRFSGFIDVRPGNNKGNVLTIDFGWYDVWEFVNDKENEPPEFEPQIVTPKFVNASIKFALNNGWNIEHENLQFRVIYKDKIYTVID